MVQHNENPQWTADYLLVQRALHQDQSAWNALYAGAYAKALAQARKCNSEKIFSQQDLEDIVDEAFLRCYYKLDTFQPISLFSTWLCGYVRYVALELKRKRFRRLNEDGIYSYTPLNEFDDPLDRLILLERNFCLWLAYDSLSRVDRALISWQVLGWRTYMEARSSTGLRKNEMLEQLNEAIAVLRRRFLAAYHGPISTLS